MEEKDILILADCLDVLRDWTESGREEFIDLIYIDPPFNSKKNYNIVFKDGSELTEKAFTDTWSRVAYLDELGIINAFDPRLARFIKMLEESAIPSGALSYLTSMALRVSLMRKTLKPTGSFYYHCDPTMSHYIKIVLDYIFGADNFKNEIVWHYQRGTKPKIMFGHKHDIILFYTKTDKWNFNQQSQPVATPDRYNLVDENGRRYLLGGTGMKTKYYLDEGTTCDDVWSWRAEKTFDQINPISKERLGYPTQKPEALLERIIKASSNEGDLVADFYMGGGTTIATAAKLGRHYIGCDINERAVQMTIERLKKQGVEVKKDFTVLGLPRSAKELKKLVDTNVLGKEKNSKLALEDIVVKYYLKGVVGNEKKVGDNSIDGRFGFVYKEEPKTGIVQITSGAGMNHFKAFCSEVAKGSGDIGVYITFADKVTDGMVKEAKRYGKLGNVDKVQILTMEDLIDRGIQFKVPLDFE